MLSEEVLICLLFCPVLLTSAFLWSAIHHLFELGKSKTRIIKDKQEITFVRKLLLIGYAEKCKHYTSKAKKLCYICWGYALVILVGFILWLLSRMSPVFTEVFSLCVYVKIVLLDVPINIYSFIMTRHDKTRGGITWAWTDKD